MADTGFAAVKLNYSNYIDVMDCSCTFCVKLYKDICFRTSVLELFKVLGYEDEHKILSRQALIIHLIIFHSLCV